MNPLRKHRPLRKPRPAHKDATRERVRALWHWATGYPGPDRGRTLSAVCAWQPGWTVQQARLAIRIACKAGLLRKQPIKNVPTPPWYYPVGTAADVNAWGAK